MSEGPTQSPGSDIYTVLLGIATTFVLLATVFVSIRSQQLFGHWLPFGSV
jgi:hypothetical protein